MTINIRRIADVDRDAWSHMVVDYDPDNAPHAERDWIRLMAGETNIRCLIADIDGNPVGFVHTLIHDFVFRRRPCCYLADLYVCPEFRRMGIARAMLHRVLDDAKLEGCGRVYWMTASDNPARNLYDQFAKADFVRYRIDF